MAELSFQSGLKWSGGRLGSGRVAVGGEAFAFSVPASMGGLGTGTNPEELLLTAVGSCYTATLVVGEVVALSPSQAAVPAAPAAAGQAG